MQLGQRRSCPLLTAVHAAALRSDQGTAPGVRQSIAHTTDKFIGILNDNEWSIAKNVGAIATYLKKLITHPSYNRLHRDFERLMKLLPKGELALKLAHKAEEGFKSAVTEVTLRPADSHLETDGRGGYGSSVIF